MLLKKSDVINKDYDVIVIGSGLAGMTAANKLAKNGRSVLLLESHNKLGGFATWFRRKGGEHIFDVSLHGFPAGMIKTCKKYWTREIADSIVPLKEVRFHNPQFKLTTKFNKEDYSRILIEEFDVEKQTVEDFFRELDEMNFYDPPNMTNGELLSKFFPNKNDVHRFLLEPIVYANGSTLEDPAITYGIVFSNFMQRGCYIYKGGTDQLINKMKEELIKNKVDIKLHSRVDNIVVENGKACGVVLKGQKIKSKAVLSNSNLLSTIFNMTGENHFSSEYINKAKQVRLNTSSCQVYMGIKEGETIPYIGDLYFHSDANEFSTEKLLSKKITSRTFSLYYPDMRPHLNNKYAIVSSTNARYEDWANLSDQEYETEKEKMIQETLNVIEKIIPGVKDKIDYVDAATPVTIEKFTLHQKGSSFGTKFEGLEISMNMQKQVRGLYHSGSVGIIMSGWLGAANYGIIQSHEVENYLETL